MNDDFTTNYFQAYDVELTNVLNTITLTVSDLAGNVTISNLNVTLDYTTATNPPVMGLIWPTNGAHLSGESFCLRGWINDETASVKAQIVDGEKGSLLTIDTNPVWWWRLAVPQVSGGGGPLNRNEWLQQSRPATFTPLHPPHEPNARSV